MKRVTSAEFQKNFGEYKREALNGPISISIHGKETLVVMSHEAYDALLRGRSPLRDGRVPAHVRGGVALHVIAAVGYEDLPPPPRLAPAPEA